MTHQPNTTSSVPAATGLAIGVVGLLLFLAASSRVFAETMILAVHPYLPTTELVNRFTPLADYLTRTTGRPIKLRVGRTYAEHIRAIGTDSVDIAYMGPASYIRMVERYGKKPLLARQEVKGQPNLRGVIIVRHDSPFRALVDLKGKRFAYGDPDSTMSHVVPQYLLQRAGVSESALAHHAFLGSHNNVVLGVLAGDYDAGAVKEEVFENQAAKGLRALAVTPPVADHVFVASGKLPSSLVVSLRGAFSRLKDTPEGRSIMHALHPNMTALVPAVDSDYDSLRALVSDVHLNIHEP